MRKTLTTLALSVALAPTATQAGGIPVIDVAAIAQLLEQITYWQQQIQGMNAQLGQLQQTYASTVGTRQMQSLASLTTAQRNYLPADPQDIAAIANGTAPGYAGLSQQVQLAMRANAVLGQSQLQGLSPEMRQTVEQGRRAAALFSAMSRTAYQNTSQRFGALQQLIAAIATAGDPKAILDLQGRIGAEQAMLANEQVKLQSLYQLAQAQQWEREQRTREQAAADVGSIRTLSTVDYKHGGK